FIELSMIEKLNKVLEKLPPEDREIMMEAFTILIEEVINAIIKGNERIWQAIDRLDKKIDRKITSLGAR
ncbi:MAG: hypothetical protein ABIL76_08945, partial [candidate division WOR-3 bacterium]